MEQHQAHAQNIATESTYSQYILSKLKYGANTDRKT